MAVSKWHQDALCAEIDFEMFFPERGGSTKVAKRVCAQCPVMKDCLEWALEHDEEFGIWGGTSERERRELHYAKRRLHRAQEVATTTLLITT